MSKAKIWTSDEFVKCLECGSKSKKYKRITHWHLKRLHGLSIREYAEKYGIPGCRMMARSLRFAFQKAAKERFERGEIKLMPNKSLPKEKRIHLAEVQKSIWNSEWGKHRKILLKRENTKQEAISNIRKNNFLAS